MTTVDRFQQHHCQGGYAALESVLLNSVPHTCLSMPSDITDLRDRPAEPPSVDRLNSWKEIAAYLKHSERTVRRWQEEGLPVHRHAHKQRAGVYAYKPELDAWWGDDHTRLKELERAKAARLPWFSWFATRGPNPVGDLRERFAAHAGRGLSWGLIASFSLAGIAALLLWLNTGNLRTRIFARSRPMEIHSIAVLPLTNLSNDPEQEYFSDGMTDELITDLAKVSQLKVISHTSVERFKGTKLPLPEIARELGVDAVVEGRVMRSGDHVRITAQLIRASTDEHIWGESFDRNLLDALAVQADIAQDVAKQINVQIKPRERTRRRNRPLPSIEAQDAYMRGRYEWNKRGPQNLLRARALFQQALDRDPNYALAWTGLADTDYLLSSYGNDVVSPREGMPRAKAAAQRALELDDGLAEAHASLAMVMWAYDWNWPAAQQEYKLALTLNPNYAIAHHFYGIGLASQGHFEESITEEKRALELDPLSQITNANLARMLYTARRYDEAITILRKIVELEPNFYPGQVTLGMVSVAAGREEEALSELHRARELAPDSTWALTNLARAYARSGQRQAALASLEELRRIAKQRYVPAYQFAIVYAELGQADTAFQWLDKAIEEPSAIIMMIKVEPSFDMLRGDPRFADVIKRIVPRSHH
jgi:TolB-like protein/Tfp pilus assembly protein PilF